MKRPLAGVRIVDVSKLEIGAGACQSLADLGAEVIKVEALDGEPIRRYVPRAGRDSVYFYALYRNRRSVALDVTREEGRRVVLDLVATADAFVEVSRPGGMERLGLTYDHLRAVNAALVYCSISSYGRSGPSAAQASHAPDIDLSAGVGFMADDPLTGEPVMGEVLAVSAVSAMSDAALAITAGVLGARVHGQGSHIEISMWDSAVAWNPVAATMALNGIDFPGGLGSRATPRHAPYRTADGKVLNISCVEHRFWNRFCALIGRSDLRADELDGDATSFGAGDSDALYDAIAAAIAAKPLTHWIDTLRAENIPFGMIRTRAEALDSDQGRARGMVWELPTAADGIRLIARPTLFDGDRGEVYAWPPRCGEHTDETLREIGYSAARIAELRSEGVIG
jgi:crotonobetainyl-CoA:carnitine CoA-transferase CaiB-like acyl-CoA transferase